MTAINLAKFIPSTQVEGPGNRFALWVQGCPKRCPGCCNPGFLEKVPAQLTHSSQLCEQIDKSIKENAIEGITLLGGEPMWQAKGLSEIASHAWAQGLSVMVFSGFLIEEILQSPLEDPRRTLLSYCDVLVDGPYILNKPEKDRNWVGSTNQRFHYLTERYGPEIEKEASSVPAVEIRIQADGTLVANGWPTELK